MPRFMKTSPALRVSATALLVALSCAACINFGNVNVDKVGVNLRGSVALPNGPSPAASPREASPSNTPAESLPTPKGLASSAPSSEPSPVPSPSPSPVSSTATGWSVEAFAGNSYAGSADGLGDAARFREIRALGTGENGGLLVAENDKLRRVQADGRVSTVRKTNGEAVPIFSPRGVFRGSGTRLYYTGMNALNLIDANGEAQALASRGMPSYATWGGLALDSKGNAYVATWGENTIFKVSPSGVITNFAGSSEEGQLDGPGTAARFSYPTRLAIDPSDNLYVLDNDQSATQSVRKIAPDGRVSTLAQDVAANDIAVDPLSTVYLLSGDVIVRIDASGNQQRHPLASTLDEQSFAHLTLASDGTLYVASRTRLGKIVKR